MDFAIDVAKTKVLISFAVTAKLICIFVFAYAKIQLSHNSHLSVLHYRLYVEGTYQGCPKNL